MEEHDTPDKAEGESRVKPHSSTERRKRSRVILDLPLYYQALDSPSINAAVAVDGSEAGLLIHSLREIPVGTRLRVEILFADEFELSNIMAMVKVLRASSPSNDHKGHGYGLSFLRIDEVNYRKLRRLLIGRRHELNDGAMDLLSAAPVHGVSSLRSLPRKKKKRPFGEPLLHLLKTLSLRSGNSKELGKIQGLTRVGHLEMHKTEP